MYYTVTNIIADSSFQYKCFLSWLCFTGILGQRYRILPSNYSIISMSYNAIAQEIAKRVLSGDRVGETGVSICSVRRWRANSTGTFCEYRIIEYRCECRYARRGDTAILQVAGRRSEFDAGGNDATEFISKSLSSHPETRTHDCRLGGKWWDPIRAFGGGVAIPSEEHNELRIYPCSQIHLLKGICAPTLFSSATPDTAWRSRTLVWYSIQSAVNFPTWNKYVRR